MPLTGKPAIASLRKLELAGAAAAVDNIRERLITIEREVNTIYALVAANTSLQSIAEVRNQVARLITQVNNLDSATELQALNALFHQPNGFVVLADGKLITRMLAAGAGITIRYPDGVVTNPIISTTPIEPTAIEDGWLWSLEVIAEAVGDEE